MSKALYLSYMDIKKKQNNISYQADNQSLLIFIINNRKENLFLLASFVPKINVPFAADNLPD